MHKRIKLDCGITVDIDRAPDKCPICNQAQLPANIFAKLTGDIENRKTKLELVMECMNLSCARFYISRYSKTHGTYNHNFKFDHSIPNVFNAPNIGQEIVNTSESFEKIFTQASEAESKQLDELAGIGYRKALEYLIKDYCISIKPDKEEDIKSNQLSRVINNYVTDENLKNCANRAVWLGNDETHYVRKWENHDLKDLKILIQLTCTWIQSSILTKKYMDEMSRD
ncbi:DUF4145 domain-containing protein [Pseudoalteromonas sp. DL-6]|uniref:DUF4145 domain-containing protein n=1 Tax=Pseudoalteromonas sp. DL-6 TaxID=1390185 RepID=UPI00103A8AE1|nr:DUF4145 domain-containing protein [Pseudoalteromonas sp. DL-6]QBJ64483.1 hypothetical protein B1F84_15605 [Pseudoalteromonas sp. DL-6]|tara:strand:+ start:50 stop:727 length:678 start_codon:yes stop_codon:yes gene_type:complete